MSDTVDDGALIELEPDEQRVITVDWDTDNLDAGVTIASSTFVIAAYKPEAISVSSITRSGTAATVTTASAHGLTTNDWVTIAGAAQSDYNVTAQVTVLTATTFTYTVANAPTTPATGTIICAAGLGYDNVSILSAAPYSSRYTQIRLIAPAASAARGGYLFEVFNTIVTSESPSQKKPRWFRVRILI